VGNPTQDETDAMTPNELLKCYYRMDTKRQTQILAYAVELREERRVELRSQRRVELRSERRTAKRPPARSTA
jgi:hypothetical protein